jgi:hypothetical protein
MSDEIKAILRARYENEVDVEQAIRRLRETNDRLRTDPAQDQRIRDIVDAVDAEIETEEDRELLVPKMAPRPAAVRMRPTLAHESERMSKRSSSLSDDRRAELRSGRHQLITAYCQAEQAVQATGEAIDQMEAARRMARHASAGKRAWLVDVPLVYLVVETVLGIALLTAVLLSALTWNSLGFSGTLGTVAAATALIAVIVGRELRGHALTLERHRKTRRAESAEAAARQAIMDLDLHWTDLQVSIGESTDELVSLPHRGPNATTEITQLVLEKYSSGHLRTQLAEAVKRRRKIVRASSAAEERSTIVSSASRKPRKPGKARSRRRGRSSRSALPTSTTNSAPSRRT